jgi:hypothetical protein
MFLMQIAGYEVRKNYDKRFIETSIMMGQCRFLLDRQ